MLKCLLNISEKARCTTPVESTTNAKGLYLVNRVINSNRIGFARSSVMTKSTYKVWYQLIKVGVSYYKKI